MSERPRYGEHVLYVYGTRVERNGEIVYALARFDKTGRRSIGYVKRQMHWIDHPPSCPSTREERDPLWLGGTSFFTVHHHCIWEYKHPGDRAVECMANEGGLPTVSGVYALEMRPGGKLHLTQLRRFNDLDDGERPTR